jgi:hypothetical protein
MITLTLPITRNSTKNSAIVELLDSTTGAPLTGKVAIDITASIGQWQRAITVITPTNLATAGSPWSVGGWKELSVAKFPGLYRLDLPDSAFEHDGISEFVMVGVQCTGASPVYIQIPLADVGLSGNLSGRL